MKQNSVVIATVNLEIGEQEGAWPTVFAHNLTRHWAKKQSANEKSTVHRTELKVMTTSSFPHFLNLQFSKNGVYSFDIKI